LLLYSSYLPLRVPNWTVKRYQHRTASNVSGEAVAAEGHEKEFTPVGVVGIMEIKGDGNVELYGGGIGGGVWCGGEDMRRGRDIGCHIAFFIGDGIGLELKVSFAVVELFGKSGKLGFSGRDLVRSHHGGGGRLGLGKVRRRKEEGRF
jgi:hypothetical protein